ncbi:MAG TPA: chromosome partitioning protein ParB, partial [Pararhizobium sp.]|nr:chromosome partitioning protein ParB [Pararhizobium sp.]
AQKDAAKAATPADSATRPVKDPDTLALERRLSDALGLKVSVSCRANGGQLRIDYSSVDQLEDICRLLGAHA